MKLGLVSGSYQNRFVDINTRRVINWYLHKDLIQDEESKYKTALLPFPGLTLWNNPGKTSGRKLFIARTTTASRCFTVCDNYLFEINTDGSAYANYHMTNMTSDSTPVYMEVNDNGQIMIAHTSACYIFDMTTNTLYPIYTSTNKASTTGGSNQSIGDTTIVVASSANMNIGDNINIVLNSGSNTTTIASIVDSTHITISVGLTVASTSGNVITNWTSLPATGLTYLSYTQSYFFATVAGVIYYSNLDNGRGWQAQNYFTPGARADKTLAAVIWLDQIICFSTEKLEVYINDGVTPFSKQPRTTLNIGTDSVDTICPIDSGILFYGSTAKGQRQVYFYNGLYCNPVAPLSVTWQQNQSVPLNNTQPLPWDQLSTYTWDKWNQYWSVVGSSGTVYADIQYSKNGNLLYYLTLPALATTYVFDMTTKEWTERQSLNPNTNVQGVYRGRCMVNWNNQNLIMDALSSKIFLEDYTTTKEDSNAVTRTLTSQIVSNEKKNLSFYDFELETVTGVGLVSSPATAASINLYLSKDGGNTFGSAIPINLGSIGQYLTRAKINKIGTARDWVFSLILTDDTLISIQEALAHGTIGAY